MKNLPSLGKLKKIADGLWSKIVRARDKCCIICGAIGRLYGHHAIVRKAKSNRTRWDIRNGVAMCFFCHKVQLHRNAEKDYLEIYLKKINEKIPQDVQVDIKDIAKVPCPNPSRSDLESIINKLTILIQGDSI